MYVYWDKLLRALLVPVTQDITHLQKCPCHPHTPPTLKVIAGHTSTQFRCSFLGCRFKGGDAVKLAACTTQSDMAEAYAMFAPGATLSHTRIDSSELRKEAYSNGRSSQEIIRGYIGKCHKALTEPAGASIPGRWTELGYNAPTGELPSYFGAVLGDEMPPELRRLRMNTQCDAYALHAYDFDGKITAISVRAAADARKRELVRLHHEAIGVYPRPELPADCDRVFLSTNELATTTLRTFSSTVFTGDRVLQAFTSLGLPLPAAFNGVGRVYLMSYPDNELSVATALQYLGTDELVEGGDKQPAVRVLELAKPPSAEQIRNFRIKPLGGIPAVALITWTAQQLIAAYVARGLDSVYQLLQHGPELTRVKDDLLGALTSAEADDTLYDAVRAYCDSPKSQAALMNGYVVYATPYGYRGARSLDFNANIEQLSNATLDVQEELLDVKGSLRYRCLLKTCGEDSAVPITLSHEDFTAGARLQRAVARELAEQRLSCRATFRSAPGFDWAEIRDAFKQTTHACKEVAAYGADELGDVHLPGLVISENGSKIEPQRRVLSIPDDISRHYNGIDYHTAAESTLGPVIELWQNDSIEAAALALGLSHTLYCIVQDMLCKQAQVIVPVQHLCYVDPLPTTWRPALEQLSALFAGAPVIGHVPGTTGRTFSKLFHRLRQLGSLPWIAELPELDPKGLQAFIRDASVNIIGLGTSDQGAVLGDLKNVAYVALDQAPEQQPGLLGARFRAKLRQSMPALLKTVVAMSQGNTVDDWTTRHIPAQSMFHGLADMFELDVRAPVDMLVRTRYIPYSRTAIDAFFRGLRELFYHNPDNPAHTIERVAPSAGGRGASAYVLPDVVLIDHAVVRDMKSPTPITPSAITKELIHANLIVDAAPGRYGVDPDRFWIVPRVIWDARVTGTLFSADRQFTVRSAGEAALTRVREAEPHDIKLRNKDSA